MLHAARPTDDDGGALLGADGGALAGADGGAPADGGETGGLPGADGDEPPVWSPPSWEQIVVEHSPRVYRLAYRLTGNKADAEDLTQETFVRVFRSLHKYQPGNFEGWLHRITTNLFLDQARRRTRVRMDPIGEATERLPSAHDSDEPERGFEHAHLDLDVQAALDALPPKYRAAVVLCDIEGLSYEEIAATLGIKMGTVRSRIHRARAMLRDQLAHRRPAGAIDPVHAAQGVG